MNTITDAPMQQTFLQLLNSIRNGCLVMIPLLFLIKTGWSLLKGFTGDQHIHYQGLFGAILLWLLVACYPEVINYLDIFCQGVIGFVEPPVRDPVTTLSSLMLAREAAEKSNTVNGLTQAATQIGHGQVLQGTGNALSGISSYFLKSVKDAGQDFLAGLVAIFASLARMVIEVIRAMLLKFLIAVGPIALSFSIIDGFGHVSRHWLQKLVSVYLWSLTLNILDHIIIDYYTAAALIPALPVQTGISADQDSPYFMDQLIVGSMYMMVPWLTGSFIGGVNAGQFLTNNVKTLSTVASTLMGSAKTLVAGKN